MTPIQRAILADVRAGLSLKAASLRHGYAPGSASRWHRHVPGWTEALRDAVRTGGRTGRVKRKFLELVASGVSVREATRRLGKCPSGPWLWAKTDPVFRAEYERIAGQGLGAGVEKTARFRGLLADLYAGADLREAAIARGYHITTVRIWRRRNNGRWAAVTRALAVGGGDDWTGTLPRSESRDGARGNRVSKGARAT